MHCPTADTESRVVTEYKQETARPNIKQEEKLSKVDDQTCVGSVATTKVVDEASNKGTSLLAEDLISGNLKLGRLLRKQSE